MRVGSVNGMAIEQAQARRNSVTPGLPPPKQLRVASPKAYTPRVIDLVPRWAKGQHRGLIVSPPKGR